MSRFVIGRRISATLAALASGVILGASPDARAQTPPGDGDTRAGRIVAQQQDKAKDLKPYKPNTAEIWVNQIEQQLLTGNLRWHPFFESAYAGGGFTLGAGYLTHVGGYETIDLRGSFTFSGYKRIEAEYKAPRLFRRRGMLSVIGGWREATQVGFYGFGTAATSENDRANYSFRQPFAAATLDFRPTPRKWLSLAGGLEYSQWEQRPGEGSAPSVEQVYTSATLPGLGAKITYLQVLGTAAVDWRDSPGYARRGGYYGVTWRGYSDTDDTFGFRQVDYEVVQHVPLFRDVWVLSFHGRVETTFTGDTEVVPFFMLPALGGGSSLRGFASWRFRDRHSLLLQAEWRALVNNFFDVALFYDAGKVAARRSDLDLRGLKSDFGIGFRLHGPTMTPLRIELAKSNEGLVIVFAAHPSF